MNGPFLSLRRFPYEEPYHVQIDFRAGNGIFNGGFDFYCGVDDLKELGIALSNFPKAIETRRLLKLDHPTLRKGIIDFSRSLGLRSATEETALFVL